MIQLRWWDGDLVAVVESYEKECCVMLVQYVPHVPDGETEKIYTVAAGVFMPVSINRHSSKSKKTHKVQKSKLRVVNLVQIALHPEWSGRNLGGLAVELAIKKHLATDGFDLLIICGCNEKFYRKLQFPSYPNWLHKSPFQLDPPKDEVRTKFQYNRDLFFYMPLTEKYDSCISSSQDTFAFVFGSSFLAGYYGIGSTTDESSIATDAIESLQISDENAESNSQR